ncbi:MAG: recombination protein NinG, partial [Cyanobacteria bacterium P01_F01_bin.3]
MPPKLKPKKCRVCKEPFTPRTSMQVVCNPRCAAQYVVQ